MGVVVMARGGHGAAIATRELEVGPRARAAVTALPLIPVIIALAVCVGARAQPPTGSDETNGSRPVSFASRGPKGPARAGQKERPAHAAAAPAPGLAVLSSKSSAVEPDAIPAKRFKIRDEFGQCVVARLHGQYGDKTLLVLPDGQLGIPNMLVPADEPFRPATAEDLQKRLHEGPFAGYQLLKTEHYLIFYQSSLGFAQDSGRLLEDLYRGLLDAFRRNEFPVHESEFPLVAVIFATEQDFRAHKRVDPKVQAYYEFFTNRIFFYQRSQLDRVEPKVTALLKPQTVAHEGTHQILSNIGVQPRLSAWPPWLVEGLAEYCATFANTKRGVAWGGLGAINALHMATLRELDDPLSIQVNGTDPEEPRPAQKKSASRTESLILKTALTPTDYAEVWALTHYLANKRNEGNKRSSDFARFLRAMSEMPPLEPRTPQDHLAEFRRYFGTDLAKLDKKIDDYVRKLSQKKGYDPLPFYAVMFEQALPQGLVHRAAMVSQSPQMIEQWIQERTAPQGEMPNWQMYPLPTRARAVLAAERWIRGF